MRYHRKKNGGVAMCVTQSGRRTARGFLQYQRPRYLRQWRLRGNLRSLTMRISGATSIPTWSWANSFELLRTKLRRYERRHGYPGFHRQTSEKLNDVQWDYLTCYRWWKDYQFEMMKSRPDYW